MDHLGERLREARQKAGLSLRQLGATAGVSASLLSQVENGRARPSVTTLYSIVAVLGVSVDELMAPAAAAAGGEPTASIDHYLATLSASSEAVSQPIRRPGQRAVLELESGVTWEQLSNSLTPFVDHLLVTYPPGSSSSGSTQLTTHQGFEHLYLISGTLHLRIDFEVHELRAGDSFAFDSNRPHVFENRGKSEPAVGVWFILGRRAPNMLRQLVTEATHHQQAIASP